MIRLVVLKCNGCGIEFERKLSAHNKAIRSGNKRFFCSPKCYKKPVEDKNCLQCDVVFHPMEPDQKFCSRGCANRARAAVRPCPCCSKQLTSSKVIYCSTDCRKQHQIQRWLSGENFALKWGGTPQCLRDYLIEESGYQCIQCQWKEVHPITGIVPLEVDHIDGDNSNNLKENLRILCPNCHSLTPNFRNLNRVGGRKRGKKIRPEDR